MPDFGKRDCDRKEEWIREANKRTRERRLRRKASKAQKADEKERGKEHPEGCDCFSCIVWELVP